MKDEAPGLLREYGTTVRLLNVGSRSMKLLGPQFAICRDLQELGVECSDYAPEPETPPRPVLGVGLQRKIEQDSLYFTCDHGLAMVVGAALELSDYIRREAAFYFAERYPNLLIEALRDQAGEAEVKAAEKERDRLADAVRRQKAPGPAVLIAHPGGRPKRATRRHKRAGQGR